MKNIYKYKGLMEYNFDDKYNIDRRNYNEHEIEFYSTDIIGYDYEECPPVDIELAVKYHGIRDGYSKHPYFKMLDITPYIGVENMRSIEDYKLRVARLHFRDSDMEYINDGHPDWIPTDEDIELFKRVLNKPKDNYPKYTNWQFTCFRWNYEYDDVVEDIDIYLTGYYDDLEEAINDPGYIPSNLSIPSTWYYDYEKAKGKRKLSYSDF
jgi:hypothetical protein